MEKNCCEMAYLCFEVIRNNGFFSILYSNCYLAGILGINIIKRAIPICVRIEKHCKLYVDWIVFVQVSPLDRCQGYFSSESNSKHTNPKHIFMVYPSFFEKNAITIRIPMVADVYISWFPLFDGFDYWVGGERNRESEKDEKRPLKGKLEKCNGQMIKGKCVCYVCGAARH